MLRQHAGYFELEGGAASCRDLPAWVWIGESPNEIFYGFPQLGGDCVKVARHVTSGSGDDADAPADEAAARAAAETLRDVLGRQLTVGVGRTVGVEVCPYTLTATEDFVLDRAPGDSRIVIGAGFSGHGFKFAPLTGRILAALALDEPTGVPEYDAARALFAIGH